MSLTFNLTSKFRELKSKSIHLSFLNFQNFMQL